MRLSKDRFLGAGQAGDSHPGAMHARAVQRNQFPTFISKQLGNNVSNSSRKSVTEVNRSGSWLRFSIFLIIFGGGGGNSDADCSRMASLLLALGLNIHLQREPQKSRFSDTEVGIITTRRFDVKRRDHSFQDIPKPRRSVNIFR